VISLLSNEIDRSKVRMHTSLAADLPLVSGNRLQLQQIFLNLLVNGIEAMAGIDAAQRVMRLTSDSHDGTEIRVTVADTGPGVEEEDIERIFDAFHSTKPNGMGMGLAICRSIADAHGAHLWASAGQPRGLVFSFVMNSSP
jgi:signal transduction histidine kinase